MAPQDAKIQVHVLSHATKYVDSFCYQSVSRVITLTALISFHTKPEIDIQ